MYVIKTSSSIEVSAVVGVVAVVEVAALTVVVVSLKLTL